MVLIYILGKDFLEVIGKKSFLQSLLSDAWNSYVMSAVPAVILNLKNEATLQDYWKGKLSA